MNIKADIDNALGELSDELAHLIAPLQYELAQYKEKDSAISLIAAERARQVEVEGWDAEHDEGNDDNQLATAAGFYALTPWMRVEMQTGEDTPYFSHVRWPWDGKWWKPVCEHEEGSVGAVKDRVREITKAGALIAAEISRLQRTLERGDTNE